MQHPMAAWLEWFSLSLTLGTVLGLCFLFARRPSEEQSHDIPGRMLKETSGAWLSRDWMIVGYRLLTPVIRATVQRIDNPTLLTWMTLVPGVLAGAAIATGLFWTATALLLVAGLLDLLDGAVARHHHRASKGGALLDSTIDRYVEFAFHAGLLLYFVHTPMAQLGVLFALMGAFLVTYSTAKGEILKIRPPRGIMKRGERVATWVAVFAVAGLLSQLKVHPGNWIAGMTLLIGILSHASAILRLRALTRESHNS